jgi:hypothetical protein
MHAMVAAEASTGSAISAAKRLLLNRTPLHLNHGEVSKRSGTFERVDAFVQRVHHRV